MDGFDEIEEMYAENKNLIRKLNKLRPILEYYANSYCRDSVLKDGTLLRYDNSKAVEGLKILEEE